MDSPGKGLPQHSGSVTLLDQLRGATGQVHQELHVHPLMNLLSTGQLTEASYRDLLVAFARPWSPLMAHLSDFPMDGLKHVLAHRFEALKNDLQVLGHALVHQDASLGEQGELVGMAYAVVGSSMGAQSLSGLVAQSLPDAPRAYLSMSPKVAGWPVVAAQLRTASPHAWPGAARGALWAFTQIKTGMDSSLPQRS